MKNSIIITATHPKFAHGKNRLLKLYLNLLKEFKSKEIGYTAIAILGQSCIGSIAVMLLMMHEMPRLLKAGLLFLIIIFSMFYNAAVISQIKSKIVFDLLIISVLISITIIIANLFKILKNN